MHKNQSLSSQHPAFQEEMPLLFLITIFPFTPPPSCPHSWHTKNCLLSPSNTEHVNDGLHRGCCVVVSLETSRWNVALWFLMFQENLIMILLLTPVPLPHILQCLHVTFLKTLISCQTPLFIPFWSILKLIFSTSLDCICLTTHSCTRWPELWPIIWKSCRRHPPLDFLSLFTH